MNEYNYDYLGINDFMPSNVINSIDDMALKFGVNNNPNVIYNSNDNNVLDPTKGFIRGNMFNNLYDPYKNYKPANLNPENEKMAMLMSFLQYNFALRDLGLYLDVYPNDRNGLNMYGKYLKICEDTKREYEKKYGPLDNRSIYVLNNSWKWDNSPWPWEVM